MSNYADTAKLEVTFMGETAAGQFLFGNGQPVGTDVFNDLPEAIARFGPRIYTGGAAMQYSGAWAQGKDHALAGKPYAPVAWKLQPQSRKEYGLGYIRGLLDIGRATTLAKPALASAIPVITPAPVPTKRKRSYRRKAK